MKPRYDIKKIKKKNPLQYLLNCKIKTKKKSVDITLWGSHTYGIKEIID